MLGVLEERVEAPEFLWSCFTEEEWRERRTTGCLLEMRSDRDACLRERCPWETSVCNLWLPVVEPPHHQLLLIGAASSPSGRMVLHASSDRPETNKRGDGVSAELSQLQSEEEEDEEEREDSSNAAGERLPGTARKAGEATAKRKAGTRGGVAG
ncbi:hypothetical protein EYF80_030687 [Liparis tanakae]|uniref:Uncharacterized protein n=1 Tax=Liparis tanakae TaxID=230148 RepID=A0A4Z2H1U0_9TELE|nr:hypothetical protein EYF80_030687 [Liparis tanakae]